MNSVPSPPAASPPPPTPGAPGTPEAPRSRAAIPPSAAPSPETLRGEASRPLHARLIWTFSTVAAWELFAFFVRAAVIAWSPEHARGIYEFWRDMPLLGSMGWFAALVLVVPGILIGVLTFFDSAERGSTNRRLRRLQSLLQESTNILAGLGPFLVRPILLATHAAMLCVAYVQLAPWRLGDPLARLGVIALCLVPNVLTMCVASLTERRMTRSDVELRVPERVPGVPDEVWSARCAQAERMWQYENELMRESVQRLVRHGSMFGFLASGVLLACAVIALRFVAPEGGGDRAEEHIHYLVPIATATAAIVSFTIHLGQILFRSASNDATARMMAWAARTLLLVGLATIFLAATLLTSAPSATAKAVAAAVQSDEGAVSGAIFQGVKGALIIGVCAGLLGERVLQAITEQAARMVGIRSLKPAALADLTAIDGLSEEDISRLAEERVDSLHALAFVPTPRLFFNTTYSLQRICDWQDQALLITHFGRTKALLFREQNVVRGAIAARRLAEQLEAFVRAGEASEGEAEAEGAADAATANAEGAARKAEREQLQDVSVALGFQNIEQAARSLQWLREDEVVQRLEVFWRSLPSWRSMPHGVAVL